MAGTIGAIRDMAVFVEVARTRSLTSAGKNLNLAPSTLSRRLTAIESKMGVRLLQRSTRSIELTDAGAEYFARSERLTRQALHLHEAFRATDDSLLGRLVVSTTSEYGLSLVAAVVPEFIVRHPRLRLELTLVAHDATPERQRDGVVLQLGPPVSGDEPRARHVATLPRQLVASAAYLAAAPALLHGRDLGRHRCILEGRSPGQNIWTLRRHRPGSDAALAIGANAGESDEVIGPTEGPLDVKVFGALAVGHAAMRARLAGAHFGVAALPMRLAARCIAQGAVVAVLADWQLPPLELGAQLDDASPNAPSAVFVDWLAARLRDPGLPN